MRMCWRKLWIESRGRLIASWLGVMLLAFMSIVIYQAEYRTKGLRESVSRAEMANLDSKEMCKLGYPAYLQSQHFGRLLVLIWPAYAFLLGTAGLVAPGGRDMRGHTGSVAFALSLPVSRIRLLSFAMINGAAGLLFVAISPIAAVWLAGFYFHEPFSFQEVLARWLMVSAGGMVFFSMAHALCMFFNGIKAVFLGTFSLLFIVAVADGHTNFPGFYFVNVIGGADYFFHGILPWNGILFSLGLSALLLWLALYRAATRDF